MSDAAKEEELRKTLLAEIEKLKAKADAVGKKVDALKKKPPVFKFSGLVKVYMDAIKASNGLTTARPATLKAVQAAEKKATIESTKAAIKGLDEHKKDVKKSAGKDNKKDLVAFEKGIDALVAGLNKHLK